MVYRILGNSRVNGIWWDRVYVQDGQVGETSRVGGMVVGFRTSKGFKDGELVIRNAKTVWVRLSDGKVVKRYIVKHGMGFYSEKKEYKNG